MRRAALGALLAAIAAIPAAAQQDVDVARGFKPGQVFESGANLDAVNLFNGVLNVTIPLSQQYPVGGTLSYGFTLHGATNTWDTGHHEIDTVGDRPVEYDYTFPWRHANAGHGWILTFGKIRSVEGSGDLWYVSPDGGQHQLYYTLHGSNTGDAPPKEVLRNDIRYTRDGTYLRLTILADRYELRFPNGHVHKFDKATGRLERMEDPFGNWMNVTAPDQTSTDPWPGRPKWVIQDKVGRTHTVYFRPAPGWVEDTFGASVAHDIIGRVDLAAFNGGTAQYEFNYQDQDNATPFTTISRRCGLRNDPTMQVVRVPLLASVKLAGYLEYTMTYDTGDQANCSRTTVNHVGASGNLTAIHTPTGGTIAWAYRAYLFPGVGAGAANSAGVGMRTVTNHDGTVLAETTYTADTITTGGPYYDMVRTVTEKDAPFQTKHYFGGCREFTSNSCHTAGFYGLPVTTLSSKKLDGAYLSREVVERSASGEFDHVVRSIYRKYEADYDLESGIAQGEYNQRLSFEKTAYENNTSSQSQFENFDGLGHYRSQTITGSWGLQNSRTTFTNFNPAAGEFRVNASSQLVTSFTMPSPDGPWLLTTFDKERVTESGTGAAAVTSETGACFDDKGFLTSRRVYKTTGQSPTPTTSDLLARYTRDADGNLKIEQYVGGDTGVLVPGNFACNATLASEQYRIEHRYTDGVRTRSYYASGNSPLPFFLLDRDVDQNTGLTKTSREASTTQSNGATNDDGIKTTYEYDLLGRLTEIRPQPQTSARRARIAYQYVMNPPQVVASDLGLDDTTLRATTSEFDSLGRLTKETRSMPSGSASRSVQYDFLGRKSADYAWGNAQPTAYTYDTFGRPLTVSAPSDSATAPGGTTTSFTYIGASTVNRTVPVRTGAPGAPVQYTPATTTEEYDPLGRLWKVTEPPPAVNGAAPITEYAYDFAGRLTKVCANKIAGQCSQQRIFDYDPRGFLRSESHPEKGTSGNGTTKYELYDARGHAGRRYEDTNPASFDVGFEFDAAERLTRVYDRSNSRSLKRFVFGDSNPGGKNYGNGRLVRAVGYNWLSNNTVVKVVEEYNYTNADGLVAVRTTADYECAVSPGPCDAYDAGTKRREFTQTFAYDRLGNSTTLGYPQCTSATENGCAGTTSERTVTNSYSAGWLTGVTWNGAASPSSITYHAQGAVDTVTHGNGVVDKQELDAGGRLKTLTTTGAVNAASCVAPTFSLQPQSISYPQSTSLTVAASGDTASSITYQLYRGSPPDVSAPEGPPSSSGTLPVPGAGTYWVRASNGCGHADSVAATVTACTAPSAAIQTQSQTITRGQSLNLIGLSSSGNTPKTYQWYSATVGAFTPIAGATSLTLPIAPTVSTAYRLRVTNDCGAPFSPTVTIAVVDPPTAPTGVTAVRSGNNSINVSWNDSSSAIAINSYVIIRLPDNVLITVPANQPRPYPDSGLLAGHAYVYRVYAKTQSGAASEMSLPDVATLMAFDDDPAAAGQTMIKGTHLGQLRQAIDALRTAASLPAAWTSYDTPAPGTAILASHFFELRDKLNEARLLLQLPPVDLRPEFGQGAALRAGDVNALRGGVQ